MISSTYERLLNNFKLLGFTESYEKLDIEYSDWKSKSNWIYKITDIWWKYGYQKWRIIFFAIAFILLFSLFNYRYYNTIQMIYPIENLKWCEFRSSKVPSINLFKKIFAVIIYSGLLFFRLGIDFRNIDFSHMRYATAIIFQYIVGLICTGFLLYSKRGKIGHCFYQKTGILN